MKIRTRSLIILNFSNEHFNSHMYSPRNGKQWGLQKIVESDSGFSKIDLFTALLQPV